MKKENIYLKIKSEEEAEELFNFLQKNHQRISKFYWPFHKDYILKISPLGNWILGCFDESEKKIEISLSDLKTLIEIK